MNLPRLMVILTILIMFSNDLGATPAPPLNYRISSPTPHLQNEEQVWVSPVDSNIVIAIWRDFRLGYRRVAVGRSTDAGDTWSDSLVNIVLDVRQSDPCVDVDAKGNFFLCYLDFDYDGASTISVVKSYDAGLTWGDLVSTGANYMSLEDKQFITVDRTGGIYDGNLYVAWARALDDMAGDTMMFARLPNNSDSFDVKYVYAPPPDMSYCGINNSDAGQLAQPLVGSDGSVYVFWFNLGLDSSDCTRYGSLSMVKSINGGTTMSSPAYIKKINGVGYIDGDIIVYPAPIGAADIFGSSGSPFDGNIYISYTRGDTGPVVGRDYNIKFIKTSDGGVTWTEPI